MAKNLLEQVTKALNRVFDAREVPRIDFRVGGDQIVLFSDLHKGARDGADEFRRAERVYNAALAYYYAAGYRLALLGDVEELWKYDVREVLSPDPHRGYRHTIELEAKFSRDKGRYIRLSGNHDSYWNNADAVNDELAPIFRKMAPHGEPLVVHRAVKLVLRDEHDEQRGEIWLTHGDQGTTLSDKLSGASHAVLRNLWRPLQAAVFGGLSTTPPSVDWELREEHDRAMQTWASNRPERPILIAGHTHRPVLGPGKKPPARAYEEVLGDLDSRPDDDPQRPALEWELAEVVRHDHAAPPSESPCYFNTGCGCNGDGDVTGLEISAGSNPHIVLVRWCNAQPPKRDELAATSLRDVLDAIAGH